MRMTFGKRALACLLALLLSFSLLSALAEDVADVPVLESAEPEKVEAIAPVAPEPIAQLLTNEPSDSDAAGVTLRYRVLTYDGENYEWQDGAVEASYYATLAEAFAAAENTDYLGQLPESVRQIAAENPSYFQYSVPTVKLLKDAVVDAPTTINATVNLDLDGHTFTVTETGVLSGDGWVTIESTTPGVFNSRGTIALSGLGPWTGDVTNVTGGTVSGYFGVDGGTVNLTGGELTGGFMFNNGGAAPIKATVSGDVCLSDLSPWSFVIYAPVRDESAAWNDIHLTLDGGYYDADPRILFKASTPDESNPGGYTVGTGDRCESVMQVVDGFRYYTRTGDSEENYVYTPIDPAQVTGEQLSAGEIFLNYRDFITVDESLIEQYAGQSDWAADPAQYPWRIARGGLPGDLNGDEAVNAKDVTTLRRYLAGGYGVTVDETVADVNRDKAVNAKDVTTLRRALAGGYGVVLG